ncbi:MAG: polysulfide reductase NrfD [Magnetococcales bacterium]|nr:polysulfide reductase NrfD [Magnetococcales bacterium]
MISEFTTVEGRLPAFYTLLIILGGFVGMAAAAFFYVEIYGHGVTGMNNKVVWGLPHIFAIAMLVMASGALNLGSMSTIFAAKQFKQFGRFSAYLAVALLIGGLAVLLFDLGRPDRMLLAMMYYNFSSMFSWNVILYTGFMMLCLLYLWTMFEAQKYTKVVGSAAFFWRLVLTTGTGSIFGVIHAREVFHSAITGPTFIAVSLSSGTAVSILLLVATYKAAGLEMDKKLVFGLRNALIFFLLLVLYFLFVEKFVKFYSPAFYDVETWILTGPLAWLYWGGVILAGIVAPLGILFNSTLGNTVKGVMWGSALAVIGEFAFVAHVLIAGQSYPFNMFPGYEVSSVFQDGMAATYSPTLPELVLGLGGVAIAGLIYLLGIRFLRLLPEKAVVPKGWDVPWNP